jgi:hypothetical protein
VISALARMTIVTTVGAWLAFAAVWVYGQANATRYIGTAALMNVQKTVATVSGIIQVAIQDQTGAAILNPTASISLPNMTTHADLRMQPTRPPASSVATFQLAVRMTSLEYSRWQLGNSPIVTFTYQGTDGKSGLAMISLVRSGIDGRAK